MFLLEWVGGKTEFTCVLQQNIFWKWVGGKTRCCQTGSGGMKTQHQHQHLFLNSVSGIYIYTLSTCSGATMEMEGIKTCLCRKS